MKNVILIFLILLTASGYCQNFVVTPKGLRNANDTSKTYVVITIDSLKTGQIFQNAVNYIQRNYEIPNEIVKGRVQDKFLKFVTSVPEICRIWKDSTDIKYLTSLTFKGNKIRYELSEVELYTCFYNSTEKRYYAFQADPLIKGIFGEDGQLLEEEAKLRIEAYFTREVETITRNLKGLGYKDTDW